MLQKNKTKAIELLTRLRKEGVSLWEENGKLRYKSPQGVLKGDDLQALKYYKKDILDLLQAEAKLSTIIPDPESRVEPFPLTDVQSAYLLGRHEAFGYGGVGCHIYMELSYPELDPERAEAIWNQLISRHDMLRVSIDQNGYQRVLKSVPHLKVSYTNASSWGKQEIEANLNQIREKLGHRVYAPDRWSLFDIAVTKTPDSTILHFSMDFLMADWASILLLFSEFETLYREPTKQLPELNLTFRDYVLAERRLRESPAYFRDKEYWLSRVNDLPPAPDLPLAQKQDKFETARFRRRFLKLDSHTWNKLKQRAQKKGLTPTIVAITAYAAIIKRWSRGRRFCLNLTVLNRLPLHPHINDIVGDFTSINLLSVDWGAGNSFYERAKTLNRQLFEDLEHRLFSGIEVLREIRRRGREDTLMPIVFTSGIGLLTRQLKADIGGYGISQTPQVFIDCQAMDSHDGLHFNWDIREGVFPDGMVDDMFDAFERLLHSLAEMDEIWDADEVVTLPTSQQIRQKQVNDTRGPIPEQLLHQQILAQAEKSPNCPAVFDSNGKMTYGELVQKAAAIAERLKELGCKTQDRVAIIMDKCAHQVTAVLGTLLAGAIYVPIDTMQPELRRSFMIEQTDAHFVLQCSSTPIPWPESTKEKIEIVEVDKLEPFNGNIPVSDIDPDLPAYIIYTSGSTGQPKGVVVSHRSVVNTIADINRRFKVNQNDRVLGLSRLSFDLSVYDIFGPLSIGGALVYPDNNRLTDPSHWAELMVEKEVTIWNTVPAIMQMLVEYASGRDVAVPESLRLVLLSGDWVPLDLPEKIKVLTKNANVISLGGTTEASIWSILYPIKEVKPGWKSIPYGKPMTNQCFYVLNESMENCPDRAPGQLYIGGIGLAKGYWKDEEKTRNSFIIHPKTGERLYRTGDLGHYLPDGNIEFLGREDNQVKVRGYRIELGEIEAALKEHSDVNSLAVVAAGDKTDKKLVAFVVANEDEKPDKTELEEFLRRKLPEYMIPSSFVFLDKMPLTLNGKIDRRELVKWKPTQAVEGSNVGAKEESLDALETEIAQLWAEALGMPSIGRLQNFYECNADSLIMARVVGKLSDKFKIPFDPLLRQTLNYPTVAELGEFIRSYNKETELALDVTSPEIQSKTQSNAVLTYYEGGQTGPLRVVFHAGLGTMNCFRLLLAHLDSYKLGPIVGISITDSERYCAIEPSEVIERFADDYARRLLETGHKQMQLIGYCIGGLIAVEVARRLVEKGILLSDLVLIDSVPMFFDISDDIVFELLFVPNLHITLEQAGFSGVEPNDLVRGFRQILKRNGNCIPEGSPCTIGGDEGLDKVGALFRKLTTLSIKDRFTAYVNAVSKVTGEQIPVEMAEGLFKTFRHSFRSASVHLFTPLPYVGDVRCLVAVEPLGLLPSMKERTIEFWREVCLGEFQVIEIEGNHISCIEEEPYATDLTKLVSVPLMKNEKE